MANPVEPNPVEKIAVVLAAGQGTRLKSALPKVLHEAAGRPLLAWVLEAARAAGCQRILVVVGHGADEVRRRFGGAENADLTWVEQREQLGTGHALAQAEPHLAGAGDATLLVLNGDTPLVRPATLERLADAAAAGWGAMAVTELDDPGSLGRVVSREGRLVRIVEAADASPEELAIRHANAGFYALPAPRVFDDLRRLGTDNAKGEYYLTDALGLAAADGRDVALVTLAEPEEGLGVNNRRELAQAHRLLLRRRAEELLDDGVTIYDPDQVTIEPGVTVGADTVIHPGVALLGQTRIGKGCLLHQGAWIRDAELADGVVIHPYTVVDGALLETGSSAGPFARLRPATEIGAGARVGNFVEIKKSRLAAGVKAGHLAYIGDAVVGERANIGAGVVTCNYDGQRKHETRIGSDAFVGSDTMLVAPVTVGQKAVTGAGSVITQDVPDGALAVGRARQRNIPNWDERRRKGD